MSVDILSVDNSRVLYSCRSSGRTVSADFAWPVRPSAEEGRCQPTVRHPRGGGDGRFRTRPGPPGGESQIARNVVGACPPETTDNYEDGAW